MTDPTHPTDKESPMTPKTRHDELKALLSKISEESVTTSNVLADIYDLLRERLPERCEDVNLIDLARCVLPSGHDDEHDDGKGSQWWRQREALIQRNLDALKHEAETPMAEHGECCEPAEDEPGRRVNVTITDVYAAPDDYGFLRINVGPETAVIDPNASNVTVTDVAPAPADDLPGEPVDHCPHSTYDRGDGTTSGCSLPSGHAPAAHNSGDGVLWTDGEHWKDEASNLNDPPGEPVEPGDLRAGDEVAFTWLSGERMTCTLVEHSHLGGVLHSDVTDASGVHRPNLTSGDLWATGISDVRLIERAPREGESPDEALAKVLHSADGTNMAAFHELTGGKRDAYLNMARAAREHIEAEQEDAVAFLRAEVEVQTDRAEKAEAALSRVEQQRDVEHAEHLNTKAALADERDRHDATITERDRLRGELADMTRQRDEARRERDNWRESSRDSKQAAKRDEYRGIRRIIHRDDERGAR